MKYLCLALLVQITLGEYLWHDVNVVERQIYTNCSDTEMTVIINDPDYGIFNDTSTTGGEIYMAWDDTSDVRQTYRYMGNGSETGFVCTDGITLVPDGNGGGLIVAKFQFADGVPSLPNECGSVVTTTDVDVDGTNDVFNWTSPIITLRYTTGISVGQDIHVFSRCVFMTKAVVSSVDIGAIGNQPELVTDFGSLFADLSMTVYKVVEGVNGVAVQLSQVMDGELVPVGQQLAAIIDLERNNEDDDVGIKHFSCYATDPYSINKIPYGMIADGCPDTGFDNTHIGDDVNVKIELSTGVTRLLFYYNQFALGSLYRLYCTVELCTPSINGDCTNAECTAKRRRKRRQASGGETFVTLNQTMYVYMEDEQGEMVTPTRIPDPNLLPETNPLSERSCTTAPEFIAPLAILGALLLILLVVCACMLRKLHSKDREMEKITYMSSSSPYPSTYKA